MPPTETWLDQPLSDAEKTFIKQGMQKNAPAPFIVHHLWICRIIGVDPMWLELDKLTELAQKFTLDGDS